MSAPPRLRCCNSCGRDCYSNKPDFVPVYCARCIGGSYQITEKGRKDSRPAYEIDLDDDDGDDE